MIKRDYIVRNLEEFGRVLSELLRLRRTKDLEHLQDQIRKAAMQFTAFEIDHVEEMTQDEYRLQVLERADMTPIRKRMLADLLFERMHYYLLSDEDEKSANAAWKCYQLYNDLFVNSSADFDLEVHYRLEYLKSR
jgi:hypothetical protein